MSSSYLNQSTTSPNFVYSLNWADPLTGEIIDPQCSTGINLIITMQSIASVPADLKNLIFAFPMDPSKDANQCSVSALFGYTENPSVNNVEITCTVSPFNWQCVQASNLNSYCTYTINCNNGIPTGQPVTITIATTLAQLVGQSIFSITETINNINNTYDSPPIFKYPRSIYVKDLFFTDRSTGAIITQFSPNQTFNVNWRTNRVSDDIGSCYLYWNDAAGEDVSHQTPIDGVVTYSGIYGTGFSVQKTTTFTITSFESATTVADIIQSTATVIYPIVTSFYTIGGNNCYNYGTSINIGWTTASTNSVQLINNGVINSKTDANGTTSIVAGLKPPILCPQYGSINGQGVILPVNIYVPKITFLDITPILDVNIPINITLNGSDIDSYTIDATIYRPDGTTSLWAGRIQNQANLDTLNQITYPWTIPSSIQSDAIGSIRIVVNGYNEAANSPVADPATLAAKFTYWSPAILSIQATNYNSGDSQYPLSYVQSRHITSYEFENILSIDIVFQACSMYSLSIVGYRWDNNPVSDTLVQSNSIPITSNSTVTNYQWDMASSTFNLSNYQYANIIVKGIVRDSSGNNITLKPVIKRVNFPPVQITTFSTPNAGGGAHNVYCFTVLGAPDGSSFTIDGGNIAAFSDSLQNPTDGGAPDGQPVAVNYATYTANDTIPIRSLTYYHTGEDSMRVSNLSIYSPSTSLFINCGGGTFRDENGYLWLSDREYNDGDTYNVPVTQSITGTTTPEIYRKQRWNGDLTYTFDVDNGTYNVIFKFSELTFTESGERVFSVSINGNTVIQDLDICAKVGQYAAYDFTTQVTVNSGKINVEMLSSVDHAAISGIQIVNAGGGGAGGGQIGILMAYASTLAPDVGD